MSAAAYYNENDPFAAAWLRALMAEGGIADGEVDERSIADVRGGDLAGFVQCHFFAGIGGWSYALRLAGWPDGSAVWTGSCPCQPFSNAGKRKGVADKRHLWPEFHRLIAECKPSSVFGEQVASKDGRLWLSGVRADLEVLGYAVGAADLCAAGVGAPHIRQRLFWVADAMPAGRAEGWAVARCGSPTGGGADGRMADAERNSGDTRRASGQPGESIGAPESGPCVESGRCGLSQRMGVSAGPGRFSGSAPPATPGHGDSLVSASFWSQAEPILCLDGKCRRIPVESALFPLAHGVPNRLGALRGAGNAIVPQVAAEFIAAAAEACRNVRRMDGNRGGRP